MNALENLNQEISNLASAIGRIPARYHRAGYGQTVGPANESVPGSAAPFTANRPGNSDYSPTPAGSSGYPGTRPQPNANPNLASHHQIDDAADRIIQLRQTLEGYLSQPLPQRTSDAIAPEQVAANKANEVEARRQQGNRGLTPAQAGQDQIPAATANPARPVRAVPSGLNSEAEYPANYPTNR